MPYKCPICGRVFRTLMGLEVHFRLAHFHGDRCPCCGGSYTMLASHARSRALDGDPCHALVYLVFTGKKNREVFATKKQLREVVARHLSV